MVSAVCNVVYLLLRHKNKQTKGEEHMNEFCTNAGWFGLFAICILVFLLGYVCGYKPRALFLLEEIEAKYKNKNTRGKE